MDIKNTAITRAIAMLTAAGAQFKVITEDGTEYGTLEVKPQVKRKKSGVNFKEIYYPVLSPMQVGDTATLIAEEGIPPEGLRSAMCGWASMMWGNGSYISERKNEVIEILRVS